MEKGSLFPFLMTRTFEYVMSHVYDSDQNLELKFNSSCSSISLYLL